MYKAGSSMKAKERKKVRSARVKKRQDLYINRGSPTGLGKIAKTSNRGRIGADRKEETPALVFEGHQERRCSISRLGGRQTNRLTLRSLK